MTKKIKLSKFNNRFLIGLKIVIFIFAPITLLQIIEEEGFDIKNVLIQILIFIIIFGIALSIKNYLVLENNGKVFFYQSLNLFNTSVLIYNKKELNKSSKIEVSKSIESDRSGEDSDFTEVYNIYLYDKTNNSIKVSSNTNYNKIRKESETIANIFKQDIIDKSLGRKQLRKFSDLNKNYIEKLKERKKAIKTPPLDEKPDSIDIEGNYQTKKITIRPQGMSIFEKVFIIFLNLSTLSGALILYFNEKYPWAFFLFAFYIATLRLCYYWLYFNNTNLSLIFSNNEVSFIKGKNYKKTLNLKDIEDIKIIKNKMEIELVFICDKKTTALPIDFSRQKKDLKYLKPQIDYLLSNIN